jgi:hypothetical protein
VWCTGNKKDISAQRLLNQRSKFSQHVTVSAGICHVGKGRLHFVAEKVKINTAYYTSTLLPQLINDCHTLLDNDFIFQRDDAPAYTARQAQQYLQDECPAFISRNEWPPNSVDLNPLDYSIWGIMLNIYNELDPKPASVAELKHALQKIWDELPLVCVQQAISLFGAPPVVCQSRRWAFRAFALKVNVSLNS